MKVQSGNSLPVSSLKAIGLLTVWMVKGLSPEITLQLARSCAGRIFLHVICRWRDRRLLWHWKGIRREFGAILPAGTKSARVLTVRSHAPND
jgi:hypothetical protein